MADKLLHSYYTATQLVGDVKRGGDPRIKGRQHTADAASVVESLAGMARRFGIKIQG